MIQTSDGADDRGGVRGAMDVTGVPLKRLAGILESGRGEVRLKRRRGRTFLVSSGTRDDGPVATDGSGRGAGERDATDDGRIAGVDRIELTQ